MSVGDVTRLPSGGIQIVDDIVAVHGTSTTMFIAKNTGVIKSLTTSGVLADLTTKIRLPGRPVAIVYTGVSGKVIACALEDGRIYTFGTDGADLALFKNLNMKIAGIYYVSNYLYVVLQGMQQEGSSLLKIQMA